MNARLGLVGFFGISGWLGGAILAAAAEAPLRVVTLTTVLTEIATTVGGEAVAVHGLVPPATDPHAYDPSPQDIRQCVDADLVFASGLGLEPNLERIVSHARTHGRLVIVSAALHDPVTLGDSDAGAGAGDGAAPDPHWWQSPKAVGEVSERVAAEIIAARPAAAPAIRARLQAWQGRLHDLESWAQAEVAKVPAERRQLVTSHDAFGWLARDLGFTVHPIKGLSPDAEPSGRRLAALVDLIRAHHIRTIFTENVENPRLLETLASETGAHLGGTLFADGPGAPGSGAETYETMYRHNVTTIIDGLAAPP